MHKRGRPWTAGGARVMPNASKLRMHAGTHRRAYRSRNCAQCGGAGQWCWPGWGTGHAPCANGAPLPVRKRWQAQFECALNAIANGGCWLWHANHTLSGNPTATVSRTSLGREQCTLWLWPRVLHNVKDRTPLKTIANNYRATTLHGIGSRANLGVIMSANS